MHLKLGIFLPKSKFPLPVPQLGGGPQSGSSSAEGFGSAVGFRFRTGNDCPMSDAARAVSVPALTLRIAPIIKVCFRGWEETFLKYVGAVGRLSQAGVRAVCRVQPSAGDSSRFGRLGRITLRALLHRCLVERLFPAGAGAVAEGVAEVGAVGVAER